MDARAVHPSTSDLASIVSLIMYGAGKRTELLMMTSPIETGSIVYDFSVLPELWISIAQALVKAAATYDVVDESG